MLRRSGPPASAQVSPPRGEALLCPCPHAGPSWHRSFPVCIPLAAVRAEWERTCGPYHKQRLAEYYGLYRDLFHGATFVPRVPLHVAYPVGEDDVMPVYHGNEVTPTEVTAGLCPFLPCAQTSPQGHVLPSPRTSVCHSVCPSFSPHQAAQAPEVTYEADAGSLWTLLLTNLGRCLGYRSQGPGAGAGPGGEPQPQLLSWALSRWVCLCADGHLLEPDAEYVHWLV